MEGNLDVSADAVLPDNVRALVDKVGQRFGHLFSLSAQMSIMAAQQDYDGVAKMEADGMAIVSEINTIAEDIIAAGFRLQVGDPEPALSSDGVFSVRIPMTVASIIPTPPSVH